jgi:RimJ/RimL family protein N-acetyltransferase
VSDLETDRLLLRQFRERDVDALARMSRDREVMRYIGEGKLPNRDDVWRAMALHLGHWQLRGYGNWAAVDKATGECVGRIGLWNPEGWPGLEIGWLLARSHWGRGLATEGGLAAREWAFATLGVDRLISVIHPENTASIRVAERLGETFERHFQLRDTPVVIYGVSRPS